MKTDKQIKRIIRAKLKEVVKHQDIKFKIESNSKENQNRHIIIKLTKNKVEVKFVIVREFIEKNIDNPNFHKILEMDIRQTIQQYFLP